MGSELSTWWLMAAIAVATGVGTVTSRNPVYSAVYLVVHFVSLAVIYLLLSAPVLFAMQLIVYAGAIMVLFLFVVMFFMSPKAQQWMRPELKGQLMLGSLLVLVFFALVVWSMAAGGVEPAAADAVVDGVVVQPFAGEPGPMIGDAKQLGVWMFRYHVLPFELIAVLLLAALVGLVLVARDQVSEGRDSVPESAPVVHPGDSADAAHSPEPLVAGEVEA